MNHHYFRADIKEWEITTVVTVKTLPFDVKTPEVRIIDETYLLYKQPSLLVDNGHKSQQTREFVTLENNNEH